MIEMDFKVLFDRYQIAMNTIHRSVNNILKEKIDSEITTDQFTTLQYIHNHENCTSTQIAHAFGIGKSSVTAQINRLFDLGFIKRVRDQEDRRVVYLYITPEGFELVEYIEKELYKVIGKQLSHFDNHEIQSFIHSLETLAKLMENKQ